MNTNTVDVPDSETHMSHPSTDVASMSWTVTAATYAVSDAIGPRLFRIPWHQPLTTSYHWRPAVRMSQPTVEQLAFSAMPAKVTEVEANSLPFSDDSKQRCFDLRLWGGAVP